MGTLEQAPTPELDTMAEDGAEECDAKPEDCEFRAGALDGQAQDCEHSPEDEILDPFEPELIPYTLSPVDGLTQPIDKPFSPAPAFTRELFVCIEDTRAHVELFKEELLDRGWTLELCDDEDEGAGGSWTTPSGSVKLPTCEPYTGASIFVRQRYDDDGKEQERKTYADAPLRLWGELFEKEPETGLLIAVRPVRERCRYFKRQLLGNDEQKDTTKIGGKLGFKNCERRRSVGGAFLSLANEAVFACDYRDPPDPASVEQWLDAHDRKILEEEPHKVLVPIFGLEGTDVRSDLLDPPK